MTGEKEDFGVKKNPSRQELVKSKLFPEAQRIKMTLDAVNKKLTETQKPKGIKKLFRGRKGKSMNR